MAKPAPPDTAETRMAVLRWQGLHVVIRPAHIYKGTRYVPLIKYHNSEAAALEDFKFCQGTSGENGTMASYHYYTPEELFHALS